MNVHACKINAQTLSKARSESHRYIRCRYLPPCERSCVHSLGQLREVSHQRAPLTQPAQCTLPAGRKSSNTKFAFLESMRLAKLKGPVGGAAHQECCSTWATNFQEYIDKLPPAKDHLNLALLNSYGTQSVVWQLHGSEQLLVHKTPAFLLCYPAPLSLYSVVQ